LAKIPQESARKFLDTKAALRIALLELSFFRSIAQTRLHRFAVDLLYSKFYKEVELTVGTLIDAYVEEPCLWDTNSQINPHSVLNEVLYSIWIVYHTNSAKLWWW